MDSVTRESKKPLWFLLGLVGIAAIATGLFFLPGMPWSAQPIEEKVLDTEAIIAKYTGLKELKEAPLPDGKTWPNFQKILDKQYNPDDHFEEGFIESMHTTAWMCFWEEEALIAHNAGDEYRFKAAIFELRQLYILPNIEKYIIDPNRSWERTVLDSAEYGSVDRLQYDVNDCVDYLNPNL
ncbi:MAG: hypothetical protein WBA28_05070 [Microbacteriaceae bacterium]